MLTITKVEFTPTGKRSKRWTGWAEYDGYPVRLTIWPEHRRMIRDAGYDVSRWHELKGEGPVATCIHVIVGRDDRNGYVIADVSPVEEAHA